MKMRVRPSQGWMGPGGWDSSTRVTVVPMATMRLAEFSAEAVAELME